ncbi:unnamed protein product [Bursaphelenchus okinawaensis]|uniref:DUF155 domain-containing protein n=1 Tax=Bursaphelenchus okinawaensis TaxID=465554 RepID=A0A811KH43_9BILA|nr:unnamed protein product [Bursaphelenchus okinawaensis]CAG9102226.1 unnamed protein product [Bursaphelenchus okinawaensis]
MNSASLFSRFGLQLVQLSYSSTKSALQRQNIKLCRSILSSRSLHISNIRLESTKEPTKPTPVVIQPAPIGQNARRVVKRRRALTSMIRKDVEQRPQIYGAAIAESVDLVTLLSDKKLASLYQMTSVDDEFEDAIHFTPKAEYNIDASQKKEFFVFGDGVLIAWHYEKTEVHRLLDVLKQFGEKPYDDVLIQQEMENMAVEETDNSNMGRSIIRHDVIRIPKIQDENKEASQALVRYAISHGMAASVKVAIWEHKLNAYSEPLHATTQALKKGIIPWRRRECLKRIGEFAALRYSTNLNSGLLNTDFYWERDYLERIFADVLRYFIVRKRLRELNSRLDYCENLVSQIDQMLTHRHASFLEWMIIVLIVIEVIFDLLHYFDFSVTPVFIVDDPVKFTVVSKKEEKQR